MISAQGNFFLTSIPIALPASTFTGISFLRIAKEEVQMKIRRRINFF